MIIQTNYTKEQQEILDNAAKDFERINLMKKYSEMKAVNNKIYENIITQMQKIVSDMDSVLGNDKMQFTSLYRYHPNLMSEIVRTSKTGKMESIQPNVFAEDMKRAYNDVNGKLTEFYQKKVETKEIKDLFKVLHDACQEVFSQTTIVGQDINQLLEIIDQVLPLIKLGVFLHIDRVIEINKALIAFRLHFINLDFIFQYIAEGNDLDFDLNNIKLNDNLYNPYSAKVKNANINLDFTTVQEVVKVTGINDKTNQIKHLILKFNKDLINSLK